MSGTLASELFDEYWYLEEYPDVEALGIDPLQHYNWIGSKLGRMPSPNAGKMPDLAGQALNANLLSGECEDSEAFESPAAGERDMHGSTYHDGRPYRFLSKRCLAAIAQRYEALKLARSQEAEVAFYCCVTGGYDHIHHHEHLVSQADYHLFTDGHANISQAETDQVPPYYQPGRAPYFDQDPVRAARFAKTHPHMLLPGYRVAIWMDGNILVRGDLSGLIRRFWESGHPVGAVPHPLRTSVYDEARECMRRAKDDSGVIEAHVSRYAAEGFESSDLIESNFMMYRLDHPRLRPFLDAWWAEIDRGSRRDQLSFNYAMRKAGATWFPLTERPDSVRNHTDLALFQHRRERAASKPRVSLANEAQPSYSEVRETRIAKFADKTCDVVVCVHNALEVVERCLISVNENRNPTRHRIVIVDDGSGAETRDWLKDFAVREPNVLLVRHEEAGGYTRAANAGLSAMNADLAILLNSDTIVAPNWIGKLLDAAFSNPGVGIVGPLSSAASHQSIPDHRSTATQTAVNSLPADYTVADLDLWCERNSPADFIPRVPLIHGFCFALKREVFEKVGLFDKENFPFGYGEENDYCFRAVNAGFSLAVATHTYVYHEKSQSYQSDRRIALVKAGNMKIRELHGKDRVLRAIGAMQDNPYLQRMRSLSVSLFRQKTGDS